MTGEAIIGANIFKDRFATVRDIVGGRSAAHERELAKARQIATGEIEAQATELGADAIIGVDIDDETVGAGMLMVTLRAPQSGWARSPPPLPPSFSSRGPGPPARGRTANWPMHARPLVTTAV